MSASNSRKALWPVCSLCPKQSRADYVPCCAGAAKRVQNSAVTNYTFLKYWFGSVGKNSFWECLSKCQLWFPLLEDILRWGMSEKAERCSALTGQPVADKQLPKIRDLDHRGKKLVACFSDSDDRLCVHMRVFIHVLLHTCRPTPFSVDVLQWIVFTSLKRAEHLWQMWLRCTVLFHLSVVPGPRAVKQTWIKIKRTAVTEKKSVKTTWFLSIEDASFHLGIVFS